MTEKPLTKNQIFDHFLDILEMEEKISNMVTDRLCVSCDSELDNWMAMRNSISKHQRGLVPLYSFAKSLPADDLGILAQAALSYLLKIQCTFAQIIMRIDVLKSQSFREVYMDSLNAISSKVKEELQALCKMVEQAKDDPEAAMETLEVIAKLEREIDEDNIIICRQINVATGGDSNYVCFIMRKIVSELEHISDFIKECAEIIADF